MTQPTIKEAASLIHSAYATWRRGEGDSSEELAANARAWLDRYEHASAAATVPGRPVGHDVAEEVSVRARSEPRFPEMVGALTEALNGTIGISCGANGILATCSHCGARNLASDEEDAAAGIDHEEGCPHDVLASAKDPARLGADDGTSYDEGYANGWNAARNGPAPTDTRGPAPKGWRRVEESDGGGEERWVGLAREPYEQPSWAFLTNGRSILARGFAMRHDEPPPAVDIPVEVARHVLGMSERGDTSTPPYERLEHWREWAKLFDPYPDEPVDNDNQRRARVNWYVEMLTGERPRDGVLAEPAPKEKPAVSCAACYMKGRDRSVRDMMVVMRNVGVPGVPAPRDSVDPAELVHRFIRPLLAAPMGEEGPPEDRSEPPPGYMVTGELAGKRWVRRAEVERGAPFATSEEAVAACWAHRDAIVARDRKATQEPAGKRMLRDLAAATGPDWDPEAHIRDITGIPRCGIQSTTAARTVVLDTAARKSLREAAGVLALLRGIDGPQEQRLAMELSAIADYVTDMARDLEDDLADADSTMTAEDAAMLARVQEAVLGQRDEQASVNDLDKADGSPEGKP